MKSIKTLRNLKASAIAAIAATVLSAGFTACESSSEIGGSIAQDDALIVVDSSFTVSGHSISNSVVLSRTITQLLGVVDAPDYGYISSEVVTQFMPAITLDTTNVTVETVDSLKLVFMMNIGAFTGDSLAPVGVEVYPLTKQLTTPIYSNFDPAGYYDPSRKLGSLIYNVSAVGQPDSIKNLKYRALAVSLPRELARDFFREYKEHPETYASPTAFAKFFPGLYFKNSYGSGRITRIENTTMQMYYHANYVNEQGHDTTVNKIGYYFSVSPEIISNNDINLVVAPEIKKRVEDGESIILAPAGLAVQFTFPGREIAATYRTGSKGGLSVINALTFSLPAEDIENKYDISAPDDVLLVLKKDLDSFFIENKTPDDVTSFRATLTNGRYTFSDMRQYIVNLIKQETIADEDVEFVLVPITVNTQTTSDYYYGTSSYVTSITPYVTEPKMCRILFDKAKINFVYTRQTAKN